jgi:hypothetical protein
VNRRRILEAALRLGDTFEKAYASLKNAGADDEADAMLSSMLELMRDLKGMLGNPDGSTLEEIRRVAAKVDGYIEQMSARVPGRRIRPSVVSRSAKGDEVEDDENVEEDGDIEEDSPDDDSPETLTLEKAIRKRLRGRIDERKFWQSLNYK